MRAFVRALPRRELVLLAVALAAAAALAIVHDATTPKPAPPSTYSSYDASGGGYRAWYALLEREGVAVARFERPAAALDAGTAVVVWSAPGPDTAGGDGTRADTGAALAAWVRGGGTLVYLGDGSSPAGFGALGLPRPAPAPARGGVPVVAPELRARGVRALAVAGRDAWSAKPGASVLVRTAAGPAIVRYPLGRGRVVAVAGERTFDDAAIGGGDVARLAFALATDGLRAGPVAFDEAQHGHAIPERWWQALPQPVDAGLAIAALAALLALVRSAFRFGPPVPPRAIDGRTTAEFVSALAALLERGGARSKALGDAAASARRAVARTCGLPADAPLEALRERLGAGTGADLTELARLAGIAKPDAATLERGVALAQRVRSCHAAHAVGDARSRASS